MYLALLIVHQHVKLKGNLSSNSSVYAIKVVVQSLEDLFSRTCNSLGSGDTCKSGCWPDYVGVKYRFSTGSPLRKPIPCTGNEELFLGKSPF